jgi:hypothetical protein
LDGFFHLGQVLLNPKTHAKNSFLLMKDFTIPTSPPPHTKIASQPLALTTTNLFQTPLIAYGHLLSIFLSLFHSTIWIFRQLLDFVKVFFEIWNLTWITDCSFSNAQTK